MGKKSNPVSTDWNRQMTFQEAYDQLETIEKNQKIRLSTLESVREHLLLCEFKYRVQIESVKVRHFPDEETITEMIVYSTSPKKEGVENPYRFTDWIGSYRTRGMQMEGGVPEEIIWERIQWSADEIENIWTQEINKLGESRKQELFDFFTGVPNEKYIREPVIDWLEEKNTFITSLLAKRIREAQAWHIGDQSNPKKGSEPVEKDELEIVLWKTVQDERLITSIHLGKQTIREEVVSKYTYKANNIGIDSASPDDGSEQGSGGSWILNPDFNLKSLQK
jgi:hypothetical protein